MIVTIDFETTGLKAGKDEVLQVSIIDEDYNILLNTYCRPMIITNWKEAEKVHGITPQRVEYCADFLRYVGAVRDILRKADNVMAYNVEFENSFLYSYGIDIDPGKWIDPMITFARIYGEYDRYHDSYKWQSLTKCADYYGYKFKAHDSLEDVKATLYCYKKMTEGSGADVDTTNNR